MSRPSLPNPSPANGMDDPTQELHDLADKYDSPFAVLVMPTVGKEGHIVIVAWPEIATQSEDGSTDWIITDRAKTMEALTGTLAAQASVEKTLNLLAALWKNGRLKSAEEKKGGAGGGN